MTTIKVNAGKPYDVKIGAGILSSLGKDIRALMGGVRAAVITDSNVAPLYLDGVLKNLEAAGYETDSFVFKAGEESKTAETLVEILEFLAMMGYTRTDVVIALGGGVVGDITGFAAAVTGGRQLRKIVHRAVLLALLAGLMGMGLLAV